jgi:membrane peptidoglycan carboxypeptidase
MRKKIAAAGVALALAGGGASLALVGPSIASATDSSSASADQQATDGTRPDPSARLTEVLKPLVDAGTITQAQADAVIQALEQARPDGMDGRGGPGGVGPGRRGPGPGLEVAATALGIDSDALRAELQSGKTIAEVASDHGVDVQTVIDAIVADLQSHLADAVTNGRMTQAEADKHAADASEHATALVNGEAPNRPGGDGHTDGPTHGPPDQPAESSTTG